MAHKLFATILTIAITIACQHVYCHAAPQQRINVSITVPSTKESSISKMIEPLPGYGKFAAGVMSGLVCSRLVTQAATRIVRIAGAALIV